MSKTKDVINHPVLAPVVDPLASMGRFIALPAKPFIEEFKDGYNDDKSAPIEKRLINGWKACLIEGGVGVNVGSMFSAFASSAAIIATAVTAAQAGIAVSVVGTAVATVAGIALAPLVAMTVAVAAAAIVSPLFAGVPGLIKGCGRFIKNVFSPKAVEAEKVVAAFAEATPVSEQSAFKGSMSKREVFMAEAAKLSTEERQALISDMHKTFETDVSKVIMQEKKRGIWN